MKQDKDTALATTGQEPSTQLVRAAESATVMSVAAREVPMIPGVDQPYRYRLPRLGKVHLGVKVQAQSGKEFPRATDFFVLPEELLQNEEFMTALAERNPDPAKPRILPVQLPCNAVSGNIGTSCDLYGSSRGLVCRSYDGVTARKVNEQTGEITEVECKQKAGTNGCCPGCAWVHRVRVMLPDAPGIGYWQIDSRSPNNRTNLIVEMMTIKGSLGGRLGGVDLLLTLEQAEFQVPIRQANGTTKVQKTTPWLLHLRSPLSKRQLAAAAEGATAYDDAEVEQFTDSLDDAPVEEEAAAPEPVEEEAPPMEGEVLPPEVEPEPEPTPPPAETPGEPQVTAKQAKYLSDLFGSRFGSKAAADAWLHERYGVSDVSELSAGQASEAISVMQATKPRQQLLDEEAA
jgi:hypothetical protein